MTECASCQNRPGERGLLNEVHAASPRSHVILPSSGPLAVGAGGLLSRGAGRVLADPLVVDLRHQRRQGLGPSACGVLGGSPTSALDLLRDPGHSPNLCEPQFPRL